MQQIVSITSQGQITIPASIRRLLGLDKYSKAVVKTEDKKIVVEPVPDLLKMGGFLKSKTAKNKSIQDIIKVEEQAVEKAVVNKFTSKK